MGFNTLRSYETGRTFPTIQNIIKIKKYYNVSYDFLLGATDDPNPNPDEQAKKNKKAINDITKILANLSKENKEV